MTLRDQQALEAQYVMNTYARKAVEFISGEGMYLTDDTGKRYLDLLSGIGTMALGHSHPKVVEALIEQGKKLMHVSNYFYIEHRGELAEKLSKLSGINGKVFFSSSGAEAGECAIKLARMWAYTNKPNADGICTASGSFHGRTITTVSATGQPERSKPFAPLTPGFPNVAFNDCDALEEALTPDTIAFMIEIIQGESGVNPASQEFLECAEKLCRERNILLIVDEVQAGIYRTGKPFAFQHYGITPDIITSAKALGCGFPIGATIARPEIADAFKPGDHGSTFGGGPLACAVALAGLTEMEETNIGEHVEKVGAYAIEKLSAVEGIISVRGKGLMIGFTLDQTLLGSECTSSLCAEKLFEQGIIVNAIHDSTIRILPPLICENVHIDILAEALCGIIAPYKGA